MQKDLDICYKKKRVKIKKILLLPQWLGQKRRGFLFSLLLKELGKEPKIGRYFRVMGSSRVSIGDRFACDQLCTLNSSFDGLIELGNYVSLAANVTLNSSFNGLISIKDNVMIGPNAVLRCSSHSHESLQTPMRLQPHSPGYITKGSNVWIGANVVVLRNVSIGDGAIVGAGSVVTKNIARNDIVGGVPAKIIRTRSESCEK